MWEGVAAPVAVRVRRRELDSERAQGAVTEPEGLAVGVGGALGAGVGVGLGEAVAWADPEGLRLGLRVTLGGRLREAAGVEEGVRVGGRDAVRAAEGLLLGERVREGRGVRETGGVGLRDVERVAGSREVAVTEREREEERLRATGRVAVGERVRRVEGEGVPVHDPRTEPLGLGLAVDVGVGVKRRAEAVADAERVEVGGRVRGCDGVAVCVGVQAPLTVSVGGGRRLRLGLKDVVGLGVGVPRGTAEQVVGLLVGEGEVGGVEEPVGDGSGPVPEAVTELWVGLRVQDVL